MWADPRRQTRLAAGLVLALTLIVWNQVFDWAVVEGANRYKIAQRQHLGGQRPFVHMKDIMEPAIAASARRATAWSLPIGIIGLLAVGAAHRRSRAMAG